MITKENPSEFDQLPVQATGLYRRFGNQKALDDISLSIAQGQVLGLVGRNGAGKSTLIRALLGLQKLDAGTSFLFGKSAQKLGDAEKHAWPTCRRKPRRSTG